MGALQHRENCSDLLGVVPFDDGTVYKEVTPQDYVEGPAC